MRQLEHLNKSENENVGYKIRVLRITSFQVFSQLHEFQQPECAAGQAFGQVEDGNNAVVASACTQIEAAQGAETYKAWQAPWWWPGRQLISSALTANQ
jgi:hypothetical protein